MNVEPVLLALQAAFLVLLYVFIWRVVRSAGRDMQVTDLVLDNGGEYGDAALSVGGNDIRMGPTSTIAGVFILNAVLAEAVDQLSHNGFEVDVYQSANMQGAEAAAEEMIRRWQSRIRGL